MAPAEASGGTIPQSVLEVVQTLGEGGPTGDLPPGKSVVFACLEACVCLLVRRYPALAPARLPHRPRGPGAAAPSAHPQPAKGLGAHADALLVKTLSAMSELPSLTSPHGESLTHRLYTDLENIFKAMISDKTS